MANLLPGVASDGNSGIKVTGNVAAGESIPATSPYVDIRAFGAVLDNATPIDSALQAAINSYQYQQGHSATIGSVRWIEWFKHQRKWMLSR